DCDAHFMWEADRPSFALYHYGKPEPRQDDSNNPPLETLGQLEWEMGPVVQNGNGQEVLLKAVPDPEVLVNGHKYKVAITKKYTLNKIGRASCREREEHTDEAREIKRR